MRIKDERGSSMIDFLGFGLLLQVPVLLLASPVGHNPCKPAGG